MTFEASKPSAIGAARQVHIYREGLAGHKPPFPISAAELTTQAYAVLPERIRAWLGGAGREDTMRANRDAFDHWKIVPRMLVDISNPDMSVDFLGRRIAAPVMLSPVGLQKVYHPDAELASARAAAALNLPFVLSNQSSVSIEEAAQHSGSGLRLFQMYWTKVPELTESIVRRAEAAGYSAIVLTVDTKLIGWREDILSLGYNPFFEGGGIAVYTSDPVFRAMLSRTPEEDSVGAVEAFLKVFSNVSLSWRDLAWLRSKTTLPIFIKGIQHLDDAKQAIDEGARGIIVSNHGGRQVDGAIGSLDALEPVVKAVDGRIGIGFDSGVRGGADGFKALALGADVVGLGRLYIYGLALGGEAGVRHVLENFLCDLELACVLSGCPNVSSVSREYVLEGR